MMLLIWSLAFLGGLMLGLYIGSRITDAKLEDAKYRLCVNCAELKAAATTRMEDVEEVWG